MKCELINFLADDGVKLDGFIKRCNEKTDNVLISIHGMTSNCFKKRDRIIANYIEKLGIDMIGFNNRGSDIVRYIRYSDESKAIAGTAYENIEDSYYDIVGAIKYAMQQGYKNIYLHGHSLGCTKIIYSYNRMKKNKEFCIEYVKGIMLISLVDVANLLRKHTKKEFMDYAENKEAEGKELELMPAKAFFHPISVKTFLKYTKYMECINFAQFSDENNDFEVINSIDIPLFMRWGNVKEMIEREADNQVQFMNKKIINPQKDINFIDGANHSFDGKEEILASQICDFLKKYN
ncbi:MAG: hypothetical protein IKG56_02600 [Clostridia bacterium]|nr:hypothetical protein [Clostridia bacterium]